LKIKRDPGDYGQYQWQTCKGTALVICWRMRGSIGEIFSILVATIPIS
jgi:hypothetical protein